MTSVVVRQRSPGSSSCGRQGVLNQIAMGLGLTSEPLRLLFTELGGRHRAAQVQMPLMGAAILTVMSKTDPNLADARARSAPASGARCGRSPLPLRCRG